MEMTFEQIKKRLAICEKLIADFKIYDEKRKKYVAKLQEYIKELPSQKDMEKAQRRITHLEKKYDTSLNEIQNLKNKLIKEHDAFEEYLDAYECAPGTVLNPKQKATYFEMTERILQLKNDNKKLREQLSEIVEKNAKQEESKSKEKPLITQVECSEAELTILRQKLTEKSVALKQLRKERKIMKQLLAKYNLTEEFEHLKTEV